MTQLRERSQTALRIGQVCVLPPEEGDLRAYRCRRRRELTRRGFLAGGIALVLGAAGLSLLPRGLGPLDLLDPRKAQAKPEWLRVACMTFYNHDNPLVRRMVATYASLFQGDARLVRPLWWIVDNDPVQLNREMALFSLGLWRRKEDVPRMVALARKYPWARQVLLQVGDASGFDALLKALKR